MHNFIVEIDSEGRLRTKLTTKEIISIFLLWTLHSYVSTFQQHLHMEYNSQLIRYSRACGSYQDFLDRGLLLRRKLLNQWFLLVKLKSSLRTFYGRHHDMVDSYGISVSQNEHGYVPLVVVSIYGFWLPLWYLQILLTIIVCSDGKHHRIN